MTKILLSLAIMFMGTHALAQFRVEVSGTGLTQLPIAIAAFKGNEGMTQKIAVRCWMKIRAPTCQSGANKALMLC